MENCIRCKRVHGLLVPLRPVSIKEFEENGNKLVNKKYVCTCGCKFERTEFVQPIIRGKQK